MYERWLAAYARSLDWVMARRLAALIFSVITLVLTAALFMVAPKGLFPVDDTGQLLAITEAAEGVSFSALIEAQQQLAAAIAKDPDVRSVTSSVGTTPAANQGQLTIDLKPIGERKRNAQEIAQDLSRQALDVPGISLFIQNPPAISIGGRTPKSFYHYTVLSGDLAKLDRKRTPLNSSHQIISYAVFFLEKKKNGLTTIHAGSTDLASHARQL